MSILGSSKCAHIMPGEALSPQCPAVHLHGDGYHGHEGIQPLESATSTNDCMVQHRRYFDACKFFAVIDSEVFELNKQ